MSFYENLVLQTQMNYSKHHKVYASGKTPVKLSQRKQLPYSEKIQAFAERVREAGPYRSGRRLRPVGCGRR